MAYFGWDFRNMIYSLENIGLLDVILPFLIIFTLTFAVLQKSKILGKDDEGKPQKKINVVLAMLLGLGVVIPHVMGLYSSYDADVVVIINRALPNVSLVLVAIVMVLLLVGIFGKDIDISNSSVGGIFIIIAVAIVAFIFLSAANVFERWYLPPALQFLNDPQFQALVVALLVFGIVIWFITKSDTKPKSDKPSVISELTKTLK